MDTIISSNYCLIIDLNGRDIDGKTPLMRLINLNAKDIHGMTPVMKYSINGHNYIVKLLLVHLTLI